MEERYRKEIKSIFGYDMQLPILYTCLSNSFADHNLNKEAKELDTLYIRYSNQNLSVSEFKEDLDKLWFS